MITTIIVNWNSGQQLKYCVDSIVGVFEKSIIVVDNSSTDGSEKFVDNNQGLTLIRSSENLGFGKACNLGARYACTEYLLFLNPDAAVYPNTLKMAIDFMASSANKKVGICGVQLVNKQGKVARSCARFPSLMGFILSAFGIDRIFPRFGHLMAEWRHDATKEVDQVIGAFFFVRRELFQELGGFDERFFVYFEEVDFSLRARQIGWRSVYLADVQAFHAGGGTSDQVKARRLFYSLRSRLLYAHKHFGPLSFIVVCLTTFLIEPISRSVLAVSRCSWASLRETWASYLMLWRWFPQWVLKGVTR